MLRIEQINLREILLPLKEPFQISSGTTKDRHIFLLEFNDPNGFVVWSECVAGKTPNYSPETIDTAWLAIREWIAPRVVGREFKSPGEIHQVLQRDFRGHNMAKAAVEMGAWELAAQIQGISLARLLGGTQPEIAIGISLGIQTNPVTLVEKVRVCREQGYKKIKMKIKPGSDVEYVRAARQSLAADVPLMVDANNAYRLDDIDTLKKLDEFNLMMIEQPLAWDDLVRHAKLQKQLKTPICLDESITTVERAEDMITLGSGRIINIKPGRVGGFTSAIAIHNLCAKHNIPVWCGGMLESGVGRAHNVALASLPNFVLPGDLSPSSRYWERDIVTPEWTMDEQGMVKVPFDRPGMGVTVDIDRVDDLTVRCETIED
jgi:O-succinylbenzoate synthase